MRPEFSVLHINTFDVGGAANSCMRLHKSLLNGPISSALLLKRKIRHEPNTFQFEADVTNFRKLELKLRRILFELKLLRNPVSKKEQIRRHFRSQLPQGSEHFSYPTTGYDITQSLLFKTADIIHLHWVADFLDYPTFFRRTKKPIVWTLHDMGPFTGGHHYDGQFSGIGENGKPCFRQFSSMEVQTIHENLKVKRDALRATKDLTIVAPSAWLTRKSQASELFSRFQHHTIPYGIDHEVFKLRDKRFARDVLGLPFEKRIILFVSDNVGSGRKGFDFLLRALSELNLDGVLLCAIGTKREGNSSGVFQLGRIDDERLMSLAYAAADVFVIPSVEDNLPNTMLEALLCGTPVIGFPIGGIAETIENGFNGYLSSDLSVEGLKCAIGRFLQNITFFNHAEISLEANRRFNLQRQAREYVSLYRSLLKVD